MKLDRTKRWLCSDGHLMQRPDSTIVRVSKVKVKKGGVAEAPARHFYCHCGATVKPVRYYG